MVSDSGLETGSELFAKVDAHGDLLYTNRRNGPGDVVPDFQLLALGFKALQNGLKITIIFSALQDDIPVDNTSILYALKKRPPVVEIQEEEDPEEASEEESEGKSEPSVTSPLLEI